LGRVTASQTRRQLTGLVREWFRRVERYTTRDPETGRIVGHVTDLNERADIYAQAGAEALFNAEFHGGGHGRLWFWRLWAWQVLDATGLPAAEDRGERRTERRTPGMISRMVEGDTPISRLGRVLGRVVPGTPEHYAALIEYHWLFLDSFAGSDEEESLFRFLRLERAARPEDPPPAEPDSTRLTPDLRLRGSIASAARVGEVIGALLQRVDREVMLPAASLGAAVARGQAKGRKTRAQRSSERVGAWAREVDRRRPGVTEQAAIVRIANQLGKNPAAVKKAIQRYRSSLASRKSRGR
jgi:hypothetical protein